MKCIFGYYEDVADCDWKFVKNKHFAQCTEICNPVEHNKLIKDNEIHFVITDLHPKREKEIE